MLKQEIIGQYDRELLLEVFVIFIEEAQETLDKIVGSYEKEEYEQTGFFAHKLKGSARMIGAVEVSDLASLIESKIRSDQIDVEDSVKELITESAILFDYIKKNYPIEV